MVRVTSGRRFARDRDESGVVAVIVAASTVVIFMLAALVVDLGHARDVRRQAQNSADASALAAGNALYDGTAAARIPEAVAAAKAYAQENFATTDADWSACTDIDALRVTAVGTPCISFENSGDPSRDLQRPDTARVRIPGREVTLPFGSLAGVSSTDIHAEAEIGVNLGVASQCSLCVLGTGYHDLANGDINVEGGDIHFNGTVHVGPHGSLVTDRETTVQGTATGAGYSPPPQTGQPPMADPLQFMPVPDMTGLSGKSDPCTQGPGFYGSIDFRNRTCTLSPGLYVIAGTGSMWNLAGSTLTRLNASGVTLYFTCGSPSAPAACPAGGAAGATLDASGNGVINISAPTSGPLEGLAVMFDRGNTATLRLAGNGTGGFTGTVYAPKATLQMDGNGCFSALHALIVVHSVVMHGNPSCLNSRYAVNQNVSLPADQLHLTK